MSAHVYNISNLENSRSGMLFWYPDQLNIQRKQFKLFKFRDITELNLIMVQIFQVDLIDFNLYLLLSNKDC